MKWRLAFLLFIFILAGCSVGREKKRKDAEVYFKKGWEARKQGAFTEAIGYYLKAVETDPEFVEAHMDYQELVSWDKGVPESLLDRYRKLLEKNKKNCIYYFLYGRLLADPEDQNREYRRALQINPDCAWALFGLAYTAYDAQKFDDAIGYLKKAISIDDKNARFHGNLGGVYFYKGLLEEAEAELKKAIELDPDYPVYYYNLFALYYKKGDYDNAIKMLDQYIKVDPYAKNIEQAKTELKQLRGY